MYVFQSEKYQDCLVSCLSIVSRLASTLKSSSIIFHRLAGIWTTLIAAIFSLRHLLVVIAFVLISIQPRAKDIGIFARSLQIFSYRSVILPTRRINGALHRLKDCSRSESLLKARSRPLIRVGLWRVPMPCLRRIRKIPTTGSISHGGSDAGLSYFTAKQIFCALSASTREFLKSGIPHWKVLEEYQTM